MLRTVARAKSLFERLRWLAPIAGGTMPALLLANRIRKDKQARQKVHFGGKEMYFRGIDERAIKEVLFDLEYDFLTDHLRSIKTPRIVDAGAHIGTFGLWVTTSIGNCDILSIEADPGTFELLRDNAEMHGTRGIAWRVLHRAASAVSGETLAFSTHGASMSHRLSKDGDVSVLTIGLADLVSMAADNAEISLLKIDIEGAEEDFICSRPELLSRIAAIVVELHPEACNTERVRGALAARYNNVVEIRGRDSSKPLLFCNDITS